MGIIQLNQIQARILERFETRIDVADATGSETALRTRGLAAWVVEELSGCTEDEAAASVVDGFHDNGLDAIYIDEPNSVVYLVQSKWSMNGIGSMAAGDIHKFVQGFKDLVNAEFDRFNAKVLAKQEALENALSNPNVTFMLVLAHTGTSPLSAEGKIVIDGLLADVNDPIDTAAFTSLTQAELHAFLRRGVGWGPTGSTGDHSRVGATHRSRMPPTTDKLMRPRLRTGSRLIGRRCLARTYASSSVGLRMSTPRYWRRSGPLLNASGT